MSTESPNIVRLRFEPELLEALRRELALIATRRVNDVLEAVHRDLAEDRRDRVLDPTGQQVEPAAWILLVGEEPLERESLAEDRRRLGRGQRRRGVEEAERLGEVAVEPVAELVRQREHRAAVTRVVHEDVRVHSRNVRRTEGAGPLAVARRRVDPALAEEALDDVARLGREVRERIQHELGGVGPAHMRGVVRERRHAVVEREPVEPEEASLQRVVALDDVVAVHDGVDERLHGLVGGVVREVARRDPGLVAAEAVVDRLVDGDRVEDEVRVRSPGSSATVTASEARRRSSRSAE